MKEQSKNPPQQTNKEEKAVYLKKNSEQSNDGKDDTKSWK